MTHRIASFGRYIAAAALTLLLTGSALGQAPLKERDDVWAQSYSDIKPDPDIRFGVLPNGMRYALMHNTTPTRQVSLRFAFHAGSVNETDAQQGLAHFLEHMAFKGSEKVPEGMIKVLERLGLAFGADTNASTSWDATIYQLDLPTADAATLDTGLLLMRETASNLSLKAADMEPERGVVLSEERVRDTPDYRAYIATIKFYLDNQIAARRVPIGKVDVLQKAPITEIQKFYRAHYRPETTTLVVVGDIDVNAVEAKIKQQFSDWKNATPKPAKVNWGTPAKKGPRVKLIVEPGVALDVSLDWINPYDDAADTLATRKRDTIRGLALAVLNRRLFHAAQQPDPPYQRASGSRSNMLHSVEVAELSVGAPPQDWKKALLAAETIRRQALQFGVRQDEVDREIEEARTGLKAAVAGASTRRSPQLANSLANAAINNNVVTSPAQRLEQFEANVKGVTAAQVSAVLKTIFQGDGPTLMVTSPSPIEGGEATLSAALREAESAPVTAPIEESVKTWPYTNFGTPGTVVSRQHIQDLDTDFIRFANGVRLTVKPTKFSAEQISVSVRIGDGLLEVPRGNVGVRWAARAMISGGLKDLTNEQIDRIFTSNVVGAGFGIGEDAFELSGATRPADLDTQMQLLAAYVTEPAFRDEAFERARSGMRVQLSQLDSTPSGVLSRDFGLLTHDGDLRWKLPTDADLDAAKPSDLPLLLRQRLAKDRIEVVIVGDTTVDRAIDAVAKTFGALPPRDDKPDVAPEARIVKFPGPTAEPVKRTHKGRADQGLAVIAWPTDDFISDPQASRAVRIAEQIMGNRLIDKFRIEKGFSYSPSTQFVASTTFEHYGYVGALVETPPERINEFFADAQAIASDIAQKGVTADEMQRARAPRIEALQRSQQTNAYWMGSLAGAQTDPRKLTIIRETITGLQKVTADDVQKAAAKYFGSDKAWKMVITPQ
jgi:zinc protease